jgi:hypothetical protein
VRRMCLCSSDKKIKTEAEFKKKNVCSNGPVNVLLKIKNRRRQSNSYAI